MTFSWNPPDLHDRTFVVTGATSGIGRATATALARAGAGARVVLAVRDVDKGARVAAEIPGETEVRPLDLADLSSVRAFAEGWDGPIDVLVNNAGVSVPDLRRSVDGFELQLATNHLGPFALTNLLLPHITDRVVTLASQAERAARLDLDDLERQRTPYKEFRTYAGTKQANLLFSAELQRRLHAVGSPVRTAAAHPGFVATGMSQGSGGLGGLMTRLLAQSPEDGALPVLYAATADLPGDSFTGPEHLMHMRGGAELINRSATAKDPDLARRLWDLSERLTGVTFLALRP
ncbi:oxidoreductase [Microlunatus spumicola]|uniref:Oxidoreductase n=1 Tax=Microlunatus spumicola TaxID=81499 RepID=A0ABP6XLE6_9ACTN